MRALNTSFTLLTILSVTGWIYAQDKPQPPGLFRVGANLVTADVVVTDKKGGYPTQLRAEDFRLFENGKPQEIHSFEAMHSATAPRLFVLLFDSLNSRWENLNQMAGQLHAFLKDGLRANDLVAIASTTPGPNDPPLDFTNDHVRLWTSAQHILRASLSGSRIEAESSALLLSADRLARASAQAEETESAQLDLAVLNEAIRSIAQSSDYSARGTLSIVRALGEGLGRLPGRKAVLLVTEGLPATEATRLHLKRAIEAANNANVSMYTLDPRALRETPGSVQLRPAARSRNFQSTGLVTGGLGEFDLLALEGQQRAADDGLNELSQATGGLAFRNSNDVLGFFTTVHRESHAYYQLTYYSADPAPGLRRIKVQLPGKNFSVRTRRGYFVADDESGPLTAEEQMIYALLATEPRRELTLQAAPSVFLDAAGQSEAAALVRVLPDGVTLDRQRDQRQAQLQLLAGFFDAHGRQYSYLPFEVGLGDDEARLERFRKQGATLRLKAPLPPGRYQLKVVARDSASGHIGTLLQELDVPAPVAGAPYMSSLVLGSRFSADAGGENPYRFGKLALQPATDLTFARSERLTILFHLYPDGDGSAAVDPDLLYQMYLFRGGTLYNRSQVYPVATLGERRGKTLVVAPQLPLESMEPGEYRVVVLVAREGEKPRVQRSAVFRVQ